MGSLFLAIIFGLSINQAGGTITRGLIDAKISWGVGTVEPAWDPPSGLQKPGGHGADCVREH